MKEQFDLSRREFLHAGLAAGAMGSGASARAAVQNDKIRLGFIGCGRRGSYLMDVALSNPDVQVTAVCDMVVTKLANAVKKAGGKPVVALHHWPAGYNDWPEYARSIGGRYRLNKEIINGNEWSGSVYLHDVSSTIKIADPRHPITRGLKDFPIVDETYGDFDVDPGVKPLLTNDHSTSSRTVALCHSYGESRVVYIQLGHDHKAYENPGYRRLVAQAIQWAVAGSKKVSRDGR